MTRHSPPPRRPRSTLPRVLVASALGLAALIAALPPVVLGAQGSAAPTATASALIDESRPEAALALLDKHLARRPKDAGALLLRSTAHFMLGNLDKGRRDLDRSLALEPENRQAWLNRAALELAEEDHAGALAAFSRAEALDPAAADNSLNIGAVLLLLERFDEARDRFKSYLALHPKKPEARYLVASNYAMLGFAQPAVANLKRAIALDETSRRRARVDPNFAPIAASAAYQELLRTDGYRHAPGSAITTQRYEEPYLAGQSIVLDAVISSLQLAGRAFDPQVEVSSAWALVWSDARIKVADDGAGGTVVEMSAAPGRYTADEWRSLTEKIFRGIKVQLHTRSRRE